MMLLEQMWSHITENPMVIILLSVASLLVLYSLFCALMHHLTRRRTDGRSGAR